MMPFSKYQEIQANQDELVILLENHVFLIHNEVRAESESSHLHAYFFFSKLIGLFFIFTKSK